MLRAFYSALLQGARASRALAEAMQTVQHTKHFAHPANWAGFLLIGGNIRLSNKVALIGQALSELMRSPDKCRDALRVCLHLVIISINASRIKIQLIHFCRLRKVFKEFIVDRRMPCIRHRRASTIRPVQLVDGKIF